MKKCKSTFGLNLCMGAFFTCFTFIFFLSLTLSLSMCAFNSFAQSGWTYEQKFNSLNDGNLAGQDGWVNRRSTVASVGNYGPYEGAKNVQMPIAQDLVTEYSRDISPVSDGIVYVAIKKSSTTVSQYIFFQNVYNDYCFVLAYGLGQNNNNIKICDKNTSVCETVLSGGANDVNYVVAIEFDGALDRVRAKVLNGESWSAWTNWVSTVFTTVGTIDLYSNGTTGGAFAYVDTFAPTDPAAVYTPATVDWNNSNVQEITLTANRSFTFTNGKSGGLYTLFINQDDTGGKTITWPANVKWAGGIAPTLTPTADAIDLIKFAYNGTNYLGNSVTLDIK